MGKRKYTFSKTDPKLIQRCADLYNSGFSTNEIAEKIGKSRAMVSLYLKHLQVDTSDTRRYAKYTLNINFFDKIDSPEKAYWLGFCLADGNVNPNKRSLRVALASKDVSHLESFKSDMEYNGHVKIYKEEAYEKAKLDLSSSFLVRSLFNKGWEKFKKNGDIEIINHVPKTLEKFLLRGLFDGDGCLTWSDKNAIFGFVSNHKLVAEWYRNKLADTLDLTKVKLKPNKNNTAYTFHYGGNRQVKKILDYLYSDGGPRLERKYNRYLTIKPINKSYNRNFGEKTC